MSLGSMILFGVLAMFSSAKAAEPFAESDAPQVSSAPVVVELFSSEICMFCPKAEVFLGDLVATKNIIGLTCMVDYMQTDDNGPGRSFCSARQSDYSEKLRSGPDYTPQIIINGGRDVVGDEPETVKQALDEVGESSVLPIALAPVASGRFSATLPDVGARNPPLSMTLFVYHRKAHQAGARGVAREWTNLVTDLRVLESWDGMAQTLAFSSAPGEGDGVALLAQDPVSGALVAAGTLNAETPVEKTEP
ncbi:MAG: DUF1223 domain-containing protein [Rhodospirillales bacterium]|nr:DUF1223 domain-containing protein [Rhodospirillales bacterium]